MKKLIIALITVIAVSACQKSNNVVIKGQFYGAADKNIVLEELAPMGATIVDSVHANSDGKFTFEIDFSQKQNPTFYNVRFESQFAPLLVEAGERIELSALGNIYYTYTVKGSKGSELLYQFNRQTLMSSKKLDSISNLISATNLENQDQIKELGREYGREYINLKRSTIKFVMTNSTSLVSIVPLYQQTYNGAMLFDQPTDIVYYKAVADSLVKKYPTSPYVMSLRNDIKRVNNVISMDSLLTSGMSNVEDFPEIEMNDPTGKPRKLSELKGNPILLNFTSSSDPSLKILNRELLEVYNKFHPKGLEIFEVSIDNNKALWLKSVTENRLPWIQVCDLRGLESVVLKAYGVTNLPTYFLIDANGDIVGAKMNHNQVKTELEKLMK